MGVSDTRKPWVQTHLHPNSPRPELTEHTRQPAQGFRVFPKGSMYLNRRFLGLKGVPI